MVDLGMTAKVRPCLILNIPASNQDRALATIVPHTTSARGSRFEVDVKVRFLHNGVFDTQNLTTIPEAKLIRKLGNLTATQLLPIENAIKIWLGL